MWSPSAPPVGKKLSFTPLALATSIAALALSAPKVPHMSSMLMATGGLGVGPLWIQGGNGVSRRFSACRAAMGGTVGVGGKPVPAPAGPASDVIPSCAATAAEPARPTRARNLRRVSSDAAKVRPALQAGLELRGDRRDAALAGF